MLRPQTDLPIPAATVRIAQAAFPKGNRYLTLRDNLCTLFTDETFAHLFPAVGQPAEAPWRLALVTVVQFAEGLSDRQAADAVRGRIDLKYLLGLELDDPGFHYSILSRFRSRLLEGDAEHLLLDKLIETCRSAKLLKSCGKARTDSTHILAGVRRLNRLEVAGETLRTTLNRLAVVAPKWLRTQVEEDWYKRYAKRFEKERVPRGVEKERELAEQIGRDGFRLLRSVYDSGLGSLIKLPEVELLRRCWVGQYEVIGGEVKWREKGNLQPAAERLDSPYDPKAHYGKKGALDWIGYKVHYTETCDDGSPHLITHVETTEPALSDIGQLESIHEALEERALLPREHFVDGGYLNSDLVVACKKELGLELIGPLKPNTHAQAKSGFALKDFTLDWEKRVAICPMGKRSGKWSVFELKGQEVITTKFARGDCRACSASRSCINESPTNSRKLRFRPEAQHEVLTKYREEKGTREWKRRYDRRAGIEGTFSQGVRATGLRKSRYISLRKNHLQNVATAAAINFQRLADWFEDIKPEQTRVSRFARLQA